MKQRKFKLSEAAIQTLSQREQETREALELRRLQAVRLYGSGEDIKVVQQVSGASRRTIQRWVDQYEAQGIGGLTPGWKGGNHRTLSEGQRALILDQISSHRPGEVLNADERRGSGEFWTVGAVAALVEYRAGVTYRSVRSYHSLLQASGLSYQRPEGVYRSRPNEAAIAEFEAESEKK
jgi:putative transposase